jgi:hypothetical protein
MTLHFLGSIPVSVVLILMTIRLVLLQTVSASIGWLMACCVSVVCGLGINEPLIAEKLHALTGVPNIADVMGRCLMVCGLLALAQSVEAAADRGRLYHPIRFIAGGAVLLTLIVLFSFIDAPVTSRTFMQTYGDQLPAALYNSIEMAYIATVIAVAAWAIRLELATRRGPSPMYWAFIVGAFGLIILAGIATAMNFAHVAGAMAVNGTLAPFYVGTFLLSMILLSVGSAWPAITTGLSEVREWHEASRQISDLEPVLRDLEQTAGRSGLYFEIPYLRGHWRRRRHRLVLEVEDRAREAGLPVPIGARASAPEGSTKGEQ